MKNTALHAFVLSSALLFGCGPSALPSAAAAPAANDWSTEYLGAGALAVHVENGSSEAIFVKIRRKGDGRTAAQVSVGAGAIRDLRLGGGDFAILLKTTSGGRPRYFKGQELPIPDGTRGEATLKVGLVGGGESMQEIGAAEFNQ